MLIGPFPRCRSNYPIGQLSNFTFAKYYQKKYKNAANTEKVLFPVLLSRQLRIK